jgi:hypothetical protein
VLCFLTSFAGLRRNQKDSATVIIKIGNISNPHLTIDSVYLIFDRYDLTGAGVIKKVFYPVNNELEITVPKGKYYIDLFCLGNYSKHFDWVIKTKTKKKNKLQLNLDASSFFTPGLVSIPPDKIDFSNLNVTR